MTNASRSAAGLLRDGGVVHEGGKIVAVDPSVINVPPSRTNFTSSINPSQPMPPRMSSA